MNHPLYDVFYVKTLYHNYYCSPRSLNQLSELLTSPNLEVRLAAGEALAIAFELGRECSEDFADEFVTDLVDTLRQLATDSHKYRAKKDRKQQRATFRDILHYIEVRNCKRLQENS